MKVLVALMTLALTGCEEDTPVTKASENGTVTCDAAAFQSLIGKGRDELELPDDLTVRMLREGQMRTMDHNPDRLNIELDSAGKVKRVFCG